MLEGCKCSVHIYRKDRPIVHPLHFDMFGRMYPLKPNGHRMDKI